MNAKDYRSVLFNADRITLRPLNPRAFARMTPCTPSPAFALTRSLSLFGFGFGRGWLSRKIYKHGAGIKRSYEYDRGRVRGIFRINSQEGKPVGASNVGPVGEKRHDGGPGACEGLRTARRVSVGGWEVR